MPARPIRARSGAPNCRIQVEVSPPTVEHCLGPPPAASRQSRRGRRRCGDGVPMKSAMRDGEAASRAEGSRAAAADPGAPAPRHAEWHCATDAAGARWRLVLTGDWRVDDDPGAAAALPPAPAAATPPAAVGIDGRGLVDWDASFAALLWQRLAAIDRSGATLEYSSLPPSLRALLELALPEAAPGPAPARPKPRPHAWLSQLGASATRAFGDARLTLHLVGRVLLSFARLLRGRASMRGRDFAWQLEVAGPRSVPIVSLVSGLVGVILAYMGALQLQRFGAQAFIADLVTIGAVREVAALMTGVILSGRIGAAYAAQLGSMQAGEEIDALRALGVDPVEHLVLPRVLAMMLVAPLLTAYGALVATIAGWAVATAVFGVPPVEYVFRSRQSLTIAHVLVGLGKGTVYAMLVALAGCRQGLYAGRSAQAVGEAVTTAVVKSLVWIVVAASALTVALQRLGW